jgi:hypothetical protein
MCAVVITGEKGGGREKRFHAQSMRQEREALSKQRRRASEREMKFCLTACVKNKDGVCVLCAVCVFVASHASWGVTWTNSLCVSRSFLDELKATRAALTYAAANELTTDCAPTVHYSLSDEAGMIQSLIFFWNSMNNYSGLVNVDINYNLFAYS